VPGVEATVMGLCAAPRPCAQKSSARPSPSLSSTVGRGARARRPPRPLPRARPRGWPRGGGCVDVSCTSGGTSATGVCACSSTGVRAPTDGRALLPRGRPRGRPLWRGAGPVDGPAAFRESSKTAHSSVMNDPGSVSRSLAGRALSEERLPRARPRGFPRGRGWVDGPGAARRLTSVDSGTIVSAAAPASDGGCDPSDAPPRPLPRPRPRPRPRDRLAVWPRIFGGSKSGSTSALSSKASGRMSPGEFEREGDDDTNSGSPSVGPWAPSAAALAFGGRPRFFFGGG
jgi:hypothetical protein